MVQWLGLSPFTAGGAGSIPGWGTKILQVAWRGQKKKKKKKSCPLKYDTELSHGLNGKTRPTYRDVKI